MYKANIVNLVKHFLSEMGLFTLYNGSIYTVQWVYLHCTMGLFTLTMGLFTLYNGSIYTVQWLCLMFIELV